VGGGGLNALASDEIAADGGQVLKTGHGQRGDGLQAGGAQVHQQHYFALTHLVKTERNG
jgi:hypothetical protein